MRSEPLQGRSDLESPHVGSKHVNRAQRGQPGASAHLPAPARDRRVAPRSPWAIAPSASSGAGTEAAGAAGLQFPGNTPTLVCLTHRH